VSGRAGSCPVLGNGGGGPIHRHAASAMITLEKLRIYQEFNGDIDGWARTSTGKDRSGIADADWYLIDELLTGLTIVGTGLASPSFVRELEAKLLASTSDEATRCSMRAHVVPQRKSGVA
jgi:hypothetical protein